MTQTISHAQRPISVRAIGLARIAFTPLDMYGKLPRTECKDLERLTYEYARAHKRGQRAIARFHAYAVNPNLLVASSAYRY